MSFTPFQGWVLRQRAVAVLRALNDSVRFSCVIFEPKDGIRPIIRTVFAHDCWRLQTAVYLRTIGSDLPRVQFDFRMGRPHKFGRSPPRAHQSCLNIIVNSRFLETAIVVGRATVWAGACRWFHHTSLVGGPRCAPEVSDRRRELLTSRHGF